MIILIVFTIVTLLSGCEMDELISNEDPSKPDLDYVIMVNGDISLPLTNFNTLNPIYSDNFYYYHFNKLIFESLFTYDNSLKIVPQLVYNYYLSDDGKILNIQLKDDVYWHDGKKLTSDDIIFTINTLKKAGESSVYYKLVSNIIPDKVDYNLISTRKIDDSTLEITFNRDTNFGLDILTFPIVSSSLGDRALDTENYTVIGTGPFKFVEYIKFKEIRLEANEFYRDGEPEIRYISGKIFEDEDLILTAFETGKISMSGSIGVDWDKYVHNPRVNIREYVSADYDAIAFNHTNPLFNGDNGNLLKKSILYSINRQEMISKIYLGHGTQTDSPIHPDSYLGTTQANIYGYEPTRARELMDSMVFTEESILGLEDYENATLKLLVNPISVYRMRIAELIKDNLSDIGIEVIIDKPEGENNGNTYFNKLVSGDYDMAIISWKQSIIPKYDYLFFAENFGISNFSKYEDADFETHVLNLSLYSQEEEKLLKYENFQNEFSNKLPYGILMYRNKALLIDSNIQGDLSPNFFNLYNGLNKCYLIMETD